MNRLKTTLLTAITGLALFGAGVARADTYWYNCIATYSSSSGTEYLISGLFQSADDPKYRYDNWLRANNYYYDPSTVMCVGSYNKADQQYWYDSQVMDINNRGFKLFNVNFWGP